MPDDTPVPRVLRPVRMICAWCQTSLGGGVDDADTQEPLMQPVEYQGQTYYTSQYFHRQYLANSQYGGKYRRHDSFLRLLRTIPAYTIYVGQNDIVELAWEAVKSTNSEVTPIRCYFQPLFQAVGYRPLMLLNATAQLALTHHLDDELSQHVSVAANTTIARTMTRKVGPLLPEETAVRKLEAYLHIGRLLKTPEHIVQQEAVKQIEVTTGVNLRPLLIAAPAQSQITSDEQMYEPKDLARELGMASAHAINRALEQIGWQVKKIGGGWEPTPAGIPYAAAHAWTADHGTKSGYNWKWRATAVREALYAFHLLPLPAVP